MLVLLGVPWIFSAFGVIEADGNEQLRMLQTCFNVSAASYGNFGLRDFICPLASLEKDLNIFT